MKKMIVITGLFFNKAGNQSFFNSIKNYTAAYEVTIVTAAPLSADIYLSVNEVKSILPNVKIISVDSRLIECGRNFRSMLADKINKISRKKIDAGARKLVNTNAGALTYFAFTFRAFALAMTSAIILAKNKGAIICAYEIVGIRALSLIRWIFSKTFSFGKFQGTVLGFEYKNINASDLKKKYRIDFSALKRISALNAAIMTNDGTNGLNILQGFGFKKENILFIQNGVDERFILKNDSLFCRHKKGSKEIRTISASRIIGWKRVDVIINAYAILVHEFEKKHFRHTIIGAGDAAEQKLINDLIRQLNLDDYVTFQGAASTAEVKDAMLHSDILISIYKFSNVANPVFEALALSLPVLSIYQEDFECAIGELMSGCFYVEDHDNDITLARRLAEKLRAITPRDIMEKSEFIHSHKDALLTWSERGARELQFIENIQKQAVPRI